MGELPLPLDYGNLQRSVNLRKTVCFGTGDLCFWGSLKDRLFKSLFEDKRRSILVSSIECEYSANMPTIMDWRGIF